MLLQRDKRGFWQLMKPCLKSKVALETSFVRHLAGRLTYQANEVMLFESKRFDILSLLGNSGFALHFDKNVNWKWTFLIFRILYWKVTFSAQSPWTKLRIYRGQDLEWVGYYWSIFYILAPNQFLGCPVTFWFISLKSWKSQAIKIYEERRSFFLPRCRWKGLYNYANFIALESGVGTYSRWYAKESEAPSTSFFQNLSTARCNWEICLDDL